MFPLFPKLRGTTLIKAFILNALCAAIISALSIEVRSYLDSLGRELKNGWHLTDLTKTLIVICSAFLCALSVYFIFYLIFGFGSGFLAEKNIPKI